MSSNLNFNWLKGFITFLAPLYRNLRLLRVIDVGIGCKITILPVPIINGLRLHLREKEHTITQA